MDPIEDVHGHLPIVYWTNQRGQSLRRRGQHKMAIALFCLSCWEIQVTVGMRATGIERAYQVEVESPHPRWSVPAHDWLNHGIATRTRQNHNNCNRKPLFEYVIWLCVLSSNIWLSIVKYLGVIAMMDLVSYQYYGLLMLLYLTQMVVCSLVRKTDTFDSSSHVDWSRTFVLFFPCFSRFSFFSFLWVVENDYKW